MSRTAGIVADMTDQWRVAPFTELRDFPLTEVVLA
jgi:hypothetical protein